MMLDGLTLDEAKDIIKNNKQSMESVVKWHTGVPKEEGEYLVILQTPNGNEVAYIGFEEYGWFGNGNCKVIAWCSLSELEPYEELDSDKQD